MEMAYPMSTSSRAGTDPNDGPGGTCGAERTGTRLHGGHGKRATPGRKKSVGRVLLISGGGFRPDVIAASSARPPPPRVTGPDAGDSPGSGDRRAPSKQKRSRRKGAMDHAEERNHETG